MPKSSSHPMDSFTPVFFDHTNASEYAAFELLQKEVHPRLIDTSHAQLRELVKARNASELHNPEALDQLTKQEIDTTNFDERFIWVHYPWRNTAVRVLKRAEFIELRTNRNQFKIKREEQAKFEHKCIAIAGLSVGNTVALTLAMERLAGKFILADFDHLELSNLNRIRAGLPELELNKCVIAARQIAEIDPYIELQIHPEGVTADNLKQFLTGENKADLLVEVCDSIPIKIQLRQFCKAVGIPVVMDTNDRGMVDIERFDLEPDRPLFHGKIEHFDLENITIFDQETRMALVSAIISLDQLSERLKYSMGEIGKTITSWPQLASGVTLGGAATANVVRRIFLDQLRTSGRFFVDLDEIINETTANQL